MYAEFFYKIFRHMSVLLKHERYSKLYCDMMNKMQRKTYLEVSSTLH